MATRSVIDIEVNDGAFKKFADSFKQYEALLKRTPATWQQAQAAMDGSRKSFQAMVAASAVRMQHAKTIALAEKEADKYINNQAKSWKDMARSTKSVASNIIDVTRQLLRWASLTSVFSGLLGAGGLFGISRLAQSAGGQRRSSMGLGLTPGQQSAFTINYGRVVGTEQVLGGVNEALTNTSKRGTLYQAGLTEAQIRGKDTSQVSVMLIEQLKRLADATPKEQLGNVFQARGLGQFISPEDFNRLKELPRAELESYRKRYEADVKTLELTKEQQRVWQNLQVQLDRAAAQIERTFTVALTNLAPEIEALSRSFQELVDAVANSPQVKQWIKDTAEGLHTFADYIGKPQFKADVLEFMANVGEAGKSLLEFARSVAKITAWIDGWLGTKDGKGGRDPNIPGETRPGEKLYVPPEAGGDPSDSKDNPLIEWLKGGGKEPQWVKDLLEWQKKAADEAEKSRKAAENEQSLFSRFIEWFLKANPGGLSPPSGDGGFSPTGYHTQPLQGLIQEVMFRRLAGGGGGFPGPGGGTPGVINTSYYPPGQGGGRAGGGLGGQNASIVHDFFRNNGWSEAATAGLMANISAESSFDPSRVNPSGGDAGLMQWRGSRAVAFQRMFGHRVQDGTLQEQLQYAQWELTQGPERMHGDILRQITDPGKAGEYVTTDIERPDPNRVGIIAAQRAALARQIHQNYRLKGGQGVSVTINNNTGGNAVVSVAAMAT